MLLVFKNFVFLRAFLEDKNKIKKYNRNEKRVNSIC